MCLSRVDLRIYLVKILVLHLNLGTPITPKGSVGRNI